MKLSRIYLILLSIIIGIGSLLRLYALDAAPPGLNWDEVAMGYNAYSILETGKDEYGAFLPKYFRSLDDYKRPVYPYVLVPSIALFGVTDFAVRFPAALFGILTIIVTFALAYELFKNKHIAILSAFVIAILPWHIQFSRAAFESTVGLFLTAFGVLTVLWGIRKNQWWLPVAALSFGLSLYSYLGQRGVVPILVLVLLGIFFKEIFGKNVLTSLKKLPILLAIIITAVFWISLARDMTGPEGTIRYKATNIFENNEIIAQNFKEIQHDGTLGINVPRRIIHSDLLIGAELVARGYLVHFSPDFFFFDLGQQHHHAPRMGIIYIWMIVPLLTGIYFLLVPVTKKEKWIVGTWILATPIAASVTFQIPHALRVAEMIVPMSIIIGSGLYWIFARLYASNRYISYTAMIVTVFTASFFVFEYTHQYLVHLPQERAKDWVYGRREAVEYAEAHKNEYDRIIVSTTLEWSYIYVLFYTQYDPNLYLKTGGTVSGNWDEQGIAFDKYEFRRFDYEEERDRNTLFIGKPDDFPEHTNPLHGIEYSDGKPVIYMVR